jgi:hypothetical protein
MWLFTRNYGNNKREISIFLQLTLILTFIEFLASILLQGQVGNLNKIREEPNKKQQIGKNLTNFGNINEKSADSKK